VAIHTRAYRQYKGIVPLFKYRAAGRRTLLRDKVRALLAAIPCHFTAVNEYGAAPRQKRGNEGERGVGSLSFPPSHSLTEKMRSGKIMVQLRNASPHHRAALSSSLAENFKYAGNLYVEGREKGQWNFHRVARGALCNRIGILPRSLG